MTNQTKNLVRALAVGVTLATTASAEKSMDKMWGGTDAKEGVKNTPRAALVRDGNYGMFIHWGLYSNIGGKWKGETFYGIGEWIKHQMKISDQEYMALAKDFNPEQFDAKEIVKVAKAAGMKWITITSKHHEGFAMFKSAHPFNIVDASPFKRDPMKELAEACRAEGLGFGFYYSHFQDWTSPGAEGGPKVNADGSPADFDKYFREKCYPQVDEICSNYGPLSFVWFDTPGDMPKKHVVALAELVTKKQPNALVGSRIGHGLGDYESLGDMQVPRQNHGGLWETPDTTNDSWSYAWYDQNWKGPKVILNRLVSAVGRGGAYLLNVGPDGTGKIPAQAAQNLMKAGEWIKKHPDVIYSAEESPWGMAQPWGDVTRNGNTLNLVVFDWPQDRQIHLSNLEGAIESVTLHQENGKKLKLKHKRSGKWVVLDGSMADAETTGAIACQIEVKFSAPAKVDPVLAIHPNMTTVLYGEFAKSSNVEHKVIHWMEKFGEWKYVHQFANWKPSGVAEWEVDVAQPGNYQLELIYKGEGRPVWSVTTSEGQSIQNQQAASHVYHAYPTGVISFAKAGKQKISVGLVAGDVAKSSLQAVKVIPVK
jgi:alpha-L-fucosidase